MRELGRAVEQRLLAVGDDDLRVGEYLGVLQLLERAHRQMEIVGGKLAGEDARIAPRHIGIAGNLVFETRRRRDAIWHEIVLLGVIQCGTSV